MSRVIVVAPLTEQAHESARLLIANGPPFDPEAAGFEHHSVFLGENEVVFLFEGPDARTSVEKLLGEVKVWKAGLAWRGLLAGEPRIAVEAWSWKHPQRAPLHVPGL